jgi:histidine triad (HIT) family protein
VFCAIANGRAPARFVYTWPDALAFVPLNPVTEGHTLVIPRKHVTDFAADPEVSAATMRRAAEAASGIRPDGPMNLITSWGAAATQSVPHLHLHLVPRAENDGLALPWYSGRRSRRPTMRTEPFPDAGPISASSRDHHRSEWEGRWPVEQQD